MAVTPSIAMDQQNLISKYRTESKLDMELYNSQKLAEPDVKVLCINLTDYSKTTQFLSCCAAVFVCYIAYGYLQELIFTLEGFKPYGWFLTLYQFFNYSVFGFLEMKVRRINKRRIPLRTYLILACLTLGTMGFSNSSLGYLNYPTQVVFKSCKLVPVLIGSVIIQRKKYNIFDYVAAVCMCAGLTLFTLADSQVSPNFDSIGVVMISTALLCDAAIGNVQEKAMKAYYAPNTEIVLYSYSIGFMYLFIIMAITGDLSRGFKFCSLHPLETYGYGFLFSFTGYMGIQVVLTLVRTCGAPVAATVTTARKAVSIVISFLFFTKPFVFQYVWSGCFIVVGIYLNVYSKRNPELANTLFARLLKFSPRIRSSPHRKLIANTV